MKTLLFKIFFLTLAVTATLAGIVFLEAAANRARYRESYLASIIDKEAWLERAGSPKIVIVGGSNAAFGIDSRRIEAETGKPVVNMAVTYRLGLPFLLNQVKNSLREGDLVIVSPEYFLLFSGYTEGGTDLAVTLAIHPSALRHLRSLKQWGDAFLELRKYLREILRVYAANCAGYGWFYIPPGLFGGADEAVPALYSRRAFDERGDFTAHLKAASAVKLGDDISLNSPIDTEAIEELNRFYGFARKKGASVLFVYPSFAASAYARNRESLQNLENYLKQNLRIPSPSAAGDSIMADHYFFDTVYHLNAEGRAMRTRALLRRIMMSEFAP